MNGNNGERLLTTAEAAAILRIHVKTLQRYARTGRIRAVRMGRQYRYRLEWIEGFVFERNKEV